jgi:hypothetical protein
MFHSKYSGVRSTHLSTILVFFYKISFNWVCFKQKRNTVLTEKAVDGIGASLENPSVKFLA